VGLIATDLFRCLPVWLIDIGLESSFSGGEVIATRLITPGPFSMTAGVMVPFAFDDLEEICDLLPRRLGEGKPEAVINDRRFAEAVYTVALANGVMDTIGYRDLPADP